MRNRKKVFIIAVAFFLLAFVIGTTIYNSFYKIDLNKFEYNFLSRIVDSPDNKHSIIINIHRTNKDAATSYIRGTLETTDNTNYKSSKLIFWQEVKTDDHQNKTINGLLMQDWVDVEWIDSQNVKINGISITTKQVYDYRRDWFFNY